MRYGINRVSISPGHLNQIKVTCNYIVSWMIRGKLNARQSKLNHQPTNNERRKQKRDVMRGVFVKWFLPMIRTSAYCEAAMACLWNCNFWSRCHPAYDCQRFVSNAQNWPSAAIQKHKNILKKKRAPDAGGEHANGQRMPCTRYNYGLQVHLTDIKVRIYPIL